MGRAPCCDKANVKRGPWSPEEDAILKHFVEKHGTGGNWIALPHKAGLRRCGKSCRLRWLNYLRPDIKHGGFSEEEDAIICGLFSSIGSRWSIIAAQLPGRTDNDIKNYWNTKLKKKLLGKGVKDDQQTRRLLAKEAADGMRFNGHNITSEAMSTSNTSSPYALEASNVPVLLQGPSSSTSSESSMSKTAQFDHYEKDFSHDSEYSNFTSILMRALESNHKSSTHINPCQTSPPSLMNPHEAALYAQRPSVNIKSEAFDQNDTQLAYSMPLWETCPPYQNNMWMHELNNGADTSFGYSLPGDDKNAYTIEPRKQANINDQMGEQFRDVKFPHSMGELLFYSNNNNSLQIKEETTNYEVTPTEAFWVSQLAAASDYILPSEGNNNNSSQGIFQEGVIY